MIPFHVWWGTMSNLMSGRLLNGVLPRGMRCRDDGSGNPTGTAEKDSFNIKLGQSLWIDKGFKIPQQLQLQCLNSKSTIERSLAELLKILQICTQDWVQFMAQVKSSKAWLSFENGANFLRLKLLICTSHVCYVIMHPKVDLPQSLARRKLTIFIRTKLWGA